MDLATRAAPTARLPWRQLGLLAVIAILVAVAVAIAVGAQHRIPAPFGPARNGVIPYSYVGDIYVGDPVTGSTKPVVKGPENDWGPGFSPDGTVIGFLRDTSSTTYDVYVVRPDGSDLRKITPAPISNESWVQWAPDGRHMGTINQAPSAAASCASFTCHANRLQMIDTSGTGSVTTIAVADGMDYVQFRPPDGRRLLYRAKIDDKWGLFEMDPDGRNVRAVVPPTVPGEMDATFADASYSADGSRVFFNMYTSDASNGDPGCCQLFVANEDGTGMHKFIPNSGGAWDGVPSVSPDGRWLAFWHNVSDKATQRVAIIPADGSRSMSLVGPELSNGGHWVWSPDSTKLLLYPDGGSNVASPFLVDPTGTSPDTTVPWGSTGDLDWQRLAP